MKGFQAAQLAILERIGDALLEDPATVEWRKADELEQRLQVFQLVLQWGTS